MAASKKRLFLSLICGIVAAILFALYAADIQTQALSTRQEALANYGGEQVMVLVATRDIAVGETLSAQNASAQMWLADLLPQGALTNPDEAWGKTVAVPLLANEPVVKVKLGELGTVVAVPEGLCAVSVPSQDVLAVGGAITAGSEVNVYAVSAAKVVLLGQKVLVLETSNGSRMGTQETGLFGGGTTRKALTWVTLAVEPAYVQELIAASRDQQLYLVLPGQKVELVVPTPVTPPASATGVGTGATTPAAGTTPALPPTGGELDAATEQPAGTR
jgi:pilus assembly protein CpaB